jgi:hypothetical protein
MLKPALYLISLKKPWSGFRFRSAHLKKTFRTRFVKSIHYRKLTPGYLLCKLSLPLSENTTVSSVTMTLLGHVYPFSATPAAKIGKPYDQLA